MNIKNITKHSAFLLPALFAASLALGQTATPDNEDIQVLDPWDVSATTTIGYGSTTSAGGSRINLPFQDVPMSVVSLNREFMDDIQTMDSYDALRFVAGMGPASTVSINSMTIRGVEVRAASFNILDGLPAGGIEQETEFVERYEVIKGPAGTLYGEHSIGGLVNRVYKRPQKERATVIKGIYGSIGNTWQGSVDHTGPITSDGALSYRVVAVARDGENAFGGDDDKTALYATIEYLVPGTTTRLWLRGENRWVRTPHETATVFFDGAGVSSIGTIGIKTPIVPIINLEERRFAFIEAGYSSSFPGLLGEWDFRIVGRYWRDRNLGKNPAIIPLGYTFLDAAGNILGATGTSSNPSQPKFSDNWADIKLTNHVIRTSGPSNGQSYGIFADLTGNFETGPLSHRMIMYVQQTGNRSRNFFTNYRLREEFGGSQLTGNLNLDNAFSIINPRMIPNNFSITENPAPSTDSFGSGERFNAGLQDNVYLWDNRILLVGGIRYDYIRNNGTTNFLTGTTGSPNTTTNWVKKGAVVVKPFENDGIAFFYNYAETFEPRFGELVSGSGIPFKNLEGETNELGAKFLLFEDRLIATASYYENRLLNNPIRIFNPNTGLDEFIQDGTTIMDGWELDMTWMINENWLTLIAIGDVNSVNPNGLRQRNVQNDLNYKGLLRYSFSPDTQLEGLSIGGSIVRVGDRAGDNGNSFVTDGFTTFDAFASYTVGNWRIQLNILNLTDEEAVASSIISSLAIANQPRSARLMVQYSF